MPGQDLNDQQVRARLDRLERERAEQRLRREARALRITEEIRRQQQRIAQNSVVYDVDFGE
jgi:hypothetical protein